MESRKRCVPALLVLSAMQYRICPIRGDQRLEEETSGQNEVFFVGKSWCCSQLTSIHYQTKSWSMSLQKNSQLGTKNFQCFLPVLSIFSCNWSFSLVSFQKFSLPGCTPLARIYNVYASWFMVLLLADFVQCLLAYESLLRLHSALQFLVSSWTSSKEAY